MNYLFRHSLEFLRKLLLNPPQVNFQADPGFGDLSLEELNKHLSALGFPKSSLKLPKEDSDKLRRFRIMRNDCAHGRITSITEQDFDQFIALLSGLADQLIDLLADAFEKRGFAR